MKTQGQEPKVAVIEAIISTYIFQCYIYITNTERFGSIQAIFSSLI